MSWRIVPLLMLFVALAHFNRISISVAGNEQIIKSGMISETEMGLIYSSFLVLYTIFMIPGGLFIDRFGPRAAWMLLGFGAAVGVALTGAVGLVFTQAVPLLLGLLVVRSVLGISNAPLHPAGARLVANWVPPKGVALANGLVTFSACIGMAFTYVLFGSLIDRFGWPRAFLITSGVTVLVAVVWTLLAADYPVGAHAAGLAGPPEPRPFGSIASAGIKDAGSSFMETRPEKYDLVQQEADAKYGLAAGGQAPQSIRGRFGLLLSDRSMLCLTLSYGALNYFEYLFFYWAEFYFRDVLKFDKDVSRLITSVLTLSMGAGMILGGWLSDRAMAAFGARRGLAMVPVLGLLLGAATNLVGVFATSSDVMIISFMVAMAAVGSGEGAYWTASVRIGGTQGGTAAAILNTGGNGVGLLAPVVTPALAAYLGHWEAGLVLASVACVAGAVLWWGVGKGLEHPFSGTEKAG